MAKRNKQNGQTTIYNTYLYKCLFQFDIYVFLTITGQIRLLVDYQSPRVSSQCLATDMVYYQHHTRTSENNRAFVSCIVRFTYHSCETFVRFSFVSFVFSVRLRLVRIVNLYDPRFVTDHCPKSVYCQSMHGLSPLTFMVYMRVVINRARVHQSVQA